MLHCVIMAGGTGTRFWPISLRTKPKQFLSLAGDTSLIQSTFDLVQPWISPEQTWVVTNRQFVDETQQHLSLISKEHILAEPCGRNTAPCVGLAALCLLAVDPDAVMLVMSSDHVISPAESFRKDVELAQELVQQDRTRLVLFGVPPTYPATGFGYIERGNVLTPGAFQVQAFHEKPDRVRAESYLRNGRFLWNCGIFLWRADELLKLLAQYEPEMMERLETLRPHVGQPSWEGELAAVFPQLKSISIDYAVLEREKNLAVVEASFAWDDVGSWEAMTLLLPSDDSGNTVFGQHVGIETSGCIIRSSADHLIATIGLENCVVVHTPRATLVARRDDENGIRRLISAITEQGLDSYL
ncbi:mannose-1-phosphate guanylyltransferase [Planctomicrobium sp. SH661]|uniref:mannose-1-phosphate guanylyltransferase n=1 Tax=Planctomicrobium sp. SH661 TaxID=3448124 RepID=UPI003F5CBC71